MLNFRKLGVDPRLALPLLVLAVAGLTVWVLMATAKPLTPPPKEKPAQPIDAIVVTKQDMRLIVQSQGTVQPQTESALISEVAGIVNWVAPNLEAGGRISKGEALLRLDSEDYETARARAKAGMARAEAELRNARNKSGRMQKLAERKLASQAQIDDASSALQLAQAAHAESTANLAQAERDLERTVIKAPYSGQVLAKHLGPGQFVNRGTELASIYASDFLEVRLPLADSELAFIDQSWLSDPRAEKPSVVLSAEFAGRQVHWDGQIDRLESNIDTRSRMVYAVAQIPPGERQAPTVGLFVTAEIAGRTETGLASIPRSALRDNDSVLIVNADEVLETRRIRIIRHEADKLLISEGLQDGDIVSVSTNPLLAQGLRVNANVGNAQPALQLDNPQKADSTPTGASRAPAAKI